MSAELLRKAAALMRERAASAGAKEDRTPEVWRTEPGPDPSLASVVTDYDGFVGGVIDPTEVETAEHIASWHPAVALAVADLIEAELAACGGTDVGLKRRHGANSPLFMLARAYLGEAA